MEERKRQRIVQAIEGALSEPGALVCLPLRRDVMVTLLGWLMDAAQPGAAPAETPGGAPAEKAGGLLRAVGPCR